MKNNIVIDVVLLRVVNISFQQFLEIKLRFQHFGHFRRFPAFFKKGEGPPTPPPEKNKKIEIQYKSSNFHFSQLKSYGTLALWKSCHPLNPMSILEERNINS